MSGDRKARIARGLRSRIGRLQKELETYERLRRLAEKRVDRYWAAMKEILAELRETRMMLQRVEPRPYRHTTSKAKPMFRDCNRDADWGGNLSRAARE